MATEDNTQEKQVDEAAQEQFVHEPDTATEDNQEATVEEGIGDEAALKKELEAEKDKFLRLFAEFENYKRRTMKERIELFKTAGQEVIQSLLPVVDDFDRAMNEIEKAKDKELAKGVGLISSKLKEVLRSKGLEPIVVNPGDAFNADLHEAVTQIPAPDKKMKGKIVDVVEQGYKLGERVIRFPKVVTGA